MSNVEKCQGPIEKEGQEVGPVFEVKMERRAVVGDDSGGSGGVGEGDADIVAAGPTAEQIQRLDDTVAALKSSATPLKIKEVCGLVMATYPGTSEPAVQAREMYAGTIAKKVRADKRQKAKILADCQPPAMKAKVVADGQSESRKLSQLNKRFGLAEVGNDLLIIKKPRSPGERVKLWDMSDFRLHLEPETITVKSVNGDNLEKPLSEEWLRWKGRSYYENGCVFEPGIEVAGAYNLFTGWPEHPTKPGGSWKKLRRHMFYNICDGDVALYRWLMIWLASIVQRPADKPGTALVFRGEQGVGKSILAEMLAKMLGRYATTSGGRNDIGAKFNGDQGEKLLIVFEEAFFVGDHGAVQHLKHQITGRTMKIEHKGVDRVEVTNHARIILITNEEQAIKAAADERRYAVFDVQPYHQRDQAYFIAIKDEMRDGGFAAMLADLESLDIDVWSRGEGWEILRRVPETEALLRQKALALTPAQEVLVKAVESGSLYADFMRYILEEDRPTEIPLTAIVEALKPALSFQEANHFNSAKARVLAESILAIAKGDGKVRWINGKAQRVVTVLPLPDCRAKLARLGVLSGGPTVEPAVVEPAVVEPSPRVVTGPVTFSKPTDAVRSTDAEAWAAFSATVKAFGREKVGQPVH